MIFGVAAAEGKLVGLLLTIFLLSFGILHVRTLVLGLQSWSYVKTDCNLSETMDGSIEYHYTVDGKLFRGQRLSYFITRPSLTDRIQQSLQKSEVTTAVYYDQFHPSRSVLQRGITIPSFIWILLWGVAVSTAIALSLDLNGISGNLHWDKGSGGL